MYLRHWLSNNLDRATMTLEKHLQHCRLVHVLQGGSSATSVQVKLSIRHRCEVCRSRMLALGFDTRGLLQPRPYLAAGAFTGSVRHHEGDVQRLKKLYEVVKSTRQQMSGCMDPSAANYDPSAASDDGTCNYLFQDEVSGAKVEGVREWLSVRSCKMHQGLCFAALCSDEHCSDMQVYVKQPVYDQQLYIYSLTPWAPLVQNLVDFVNSTLKNVWTSKVMLTALAVFH